MLSDKELQHMRDAIGSLFPDTCELLTATSVSDSEGGFTDTWGTVTHQVPCRLDVVTGQERMTDGSLRPYNYFELATPYDTVITEAYRVVLNDVTYLVTGVNNEQSWSVEKVVRVEQA